MISKSFVVLCCLLVAVLAVDKYSSKYDNMNIQELMENERTRKSYGDCLLDEGKCTAQGNEVKDHMQEALETGCAKCTEAQKKGIQTVIDYLLKHDLELWNKLTAKYDPTGKWRKKYEEQARERGIVIPSK